jgi:hypothetical protein
MNGVGRVRSPPQVESRWEPWMMVRKENRIRSSRSPLMVLSVLGGMTYATCAEQTMSVVVRAANLGG